MYVLDSEELSAGSSPRLAGGLFFFAPQIFRVGRQAGVYGRGAAERRFDVSVPLGLYMDHQDTLCSEGC
jgi:hypothetical protein